MFEKDTLQKKFKTQFTIVAAIKAGNEKPLKSIYKVNFKKVEQYILKNSGSAQQAKDIYQEAFITLWENIHLDKFTPTNETALNGYLYTIAKHKWLNYLKSKNYKKTEMLTDLKLKFIGNTATNELDENEFQSEKLNKIVTSFNTLKEPCKKMLSFFYYDNKSIREIAKDLNIGEASAKNKKYRCLERLRTMVLLTN